MSTQPVKQAPELSPEGEAIAACSAAMLTALQVLVGCLVESGALQQGQFPEALRRFVEANKHREDELQLGLLRNLRRSFLD
jgi:hypothetical protein